MRINKANVFYLVTLTLFLLGGGWLVSEIISSWSLFFRFKSSLPTMAVGQNADTLVQEGRQFLELRDLNSANNRFKSAVQVAHNHPTANFFYSVTRIPALLYQEEVNRFPDRFGISKEGRDILNWTADFPRDSLGNIILPANSPRGKEVQQFLADILLTEIAGALKNLAVLDATFVLSLSPKETGSDNYLEVDWGDVSLYRASLYGMELALLVTMSYDIDLDVDELFSQISKGTFNIHSLLQTYPNLLNILGSNQLGVAKGIARNGINSYLEASEFIRNETDNQLDDLVTFSEDKMEEEQRFRTLLGEILHSLSGPTNISTISCISSLDLTQFFDNPKSMREFLPEFTDKNRIVPRSFPDPTFGSILPNAAQDTLDCLFGRQEPNLQHYIYTNKSAYTTGDTLIVSISIDNPGPTVKVDAFNGVILPDGSIYFRDSSGKFVEANINNPTTFTPSATSLTITSGYSLPKTPILSFELPAIPPGIYTLFSAYAEPGSAQAGSPKLIGGIALAQFTFTP